MRLRDLLSEPRSHSEQNPHVSVEEALRPYRSDPNVYVSFTDEAPSLVPEGSADRRVGGRTAGSGPKVGIEACAEHASGSAPVRAYPLREMWEAIISGSLPGSGGRGCVQVLRAPGPVLDLRTYTTESLQRDAAKLEPVLGGTIRSKGLIGGKLVIEGWEEALQRDRVIEQFGEVIQHAVTLLSHSGPEADANRAASGGLLSKLGYAAVMESAAQAAFLMPSRFEVIATLPKDAQQHLPISSPPATVKEQSLNEAGWSDRSPLIQDLAKSKGRWIHFSRVPKIGVNPRSGWTMTGPYGVYLYPVDFFLAGNERIEDGQQFGTDMPYYFLCDIDLSMPGLNLSKMTEADADRIAEANGFLPRLQEFRASLIPGQKPGVTFWKLLRKFNDHNEMTWNRALRGLAYVIDETGIMYGHLEPQQAVVLNPRALKNISMHSNTVSGFQAINSDNQRERHGAWKKVYADVINGLKDKYGGAIRWQERPDLVPYGEQRTKAKVRRRAPAMPVLRFESNGRSFEITPVQGGMSHGFRLNFRNGRESDIRTVNADDMRTLSTAQMIQKLSGFIDEVIGFESDLRFKPFLDEDEADHMIQEGIGRRGTPFTIETEVANSKGGGGTIIYRGERETEHGDVKVKTAIRLTVGPNGFGGGYRIDLMGKGFMDVLLWGEDFTDRDAMMEKLAEEFVEKLGMYERLYGPSNTSREPFIFRDQAQWEAFKGWLVFNSGLYFDGKLYGHLSDAAMAYNDYEDQDGLSWRIATIFRHGY